MHQAHFTGGLCSEYFTYSLKADFQANRLHLFSPYFSCHLINLSANCHPSVPNLL